jgi:hypothetical protein
MFRRDHEIPVQVPKALRVVLSIDFLELPRETRFFKLALSPIAI